MKNEDLNATVALNPAALAALLEQVRQIQQGSQGELAADPLALGEEVVPEAEREPADSAPQRR
jgi:hypothetical protein